MWIGCHIPEDCAHIRAGLGGECVNWNSQNCDKLYQQLSPTIFQRLTELPHSLDCPTEIMVTLPPIPPGRYGSKNAANV